MAAFTSSRYTPKERAARVERYGEGPWVDEPDKRVWQAHGFTCDAARELQSGHWCGYVHLPPGHPWYGHPYIGFSLLIEGERAITHAAEEDGHWVIGFHCAHDGDYPPGLMTLLNRVAKHESKLFPREGYRDLAYVQRATEHIAEQARTVATAG